MKAKDSDNGTDTAYVALPERDFAWGDVEEVPDAPGVKAVEAKATGSAYIDLKGEAHLPGDAAAYVVEGADTYREEFGIGTIDVPSTYGAIRDNFDPVTVFASTTCKEYAAGISARRLEAAVRVAVGGGRFSADDLTVTVCENRGFMIESDDGAFLVTLDQLYGPDDVFHDRSIMQSDSPHSTTDVAGFTLVDEESSYIHDILPEYIAAAEEHLDVEFVSFSHRTNNKLVFEGVGEHQLVIKGSDVIRFEDVAKTREELEEQSDDSVNWPGAFEYDIGDVKDPVLEKEDNNSGRCIGWKRGKKRQTRIYTTTSKWFEAPYFLRPVVKDNIGKIQIKLDKGSERDAER